MSILNDTLKSLDERNQNEDFGLPPTVQVENRSLWPKALIALVLIGLVIWLVLSNMTESGDSKSAANTGSLDAVAKVDVPNTAASSVQNESITTDSESTSKQDVDSAEQQLEGMKSTPLSEEDLAYQNTPSDVAEIVFNSIDETVVDDEAEYRQRTQAANSSSSNSDAQLQEEQLSYRRVHSLYSIRDMKNTTYSCSFFLWPSWVVLVTHPTEIELTCKKNQLKTIPSRKRLES